MGLGLGDNLKIHENKEKRQHRSELKKEAIQKRENKRECQNARKEAIQMREHEQM